MKAIFAVTALAAAISGQALAADTEATTTFSGAMDARVVYNMAGATEALTPLDSTYDVDLDDDNDFLYGLSMNVAVVNGPFSGEIGIESDEAGTPEVTVGDLIVTDGKLSFGQVGNLTLTDEYVVGAVSMDDDDEGGVVNDIEDSIGFRYMAAEGFTVQLGGDEVDASGVTFVVASAQYQAEAGDLAYVVEGQMKASSYGAENDMSAPTFIGAGVTYTTDMVTVTAALNMASDTNGDSDTEYAINATTNLAGATVSVGYHEPSTENTVDDEILDAEVSYAIDAITLSAGYRLTTLADAGDEVTGGVAWAQDMWSASADFTVANFDASTADDLKTELNVTYSAESGVDYYGDYTLQGDTTNNIVVGAKYSF